MIGTTEVSSLNMEAMVLIMALVRSISVWLLCHWGKGILCPELSKLMEAELLLRGRTKTNTRTEIIYIPILTSGGAMEINNDFETSVSSP